MKRSIEAALVALALVATICRADLVLIGKVSYYDPTFVKNIPMRFYISTAAGDTAKDKTGYTDSTGQWSITFHGINGGAFYWVDAPGTAAQINGTNPSDLIAVSLPQKTDDYPNGRGDTCEISMANFTMYQQVNLGFLTRDSILISGTVTDGDASTPVKNAAINFSFHNYALNKDTVLSTTTDFGGTFEFPIFFNDGCYIKTHLSIPATGDYLSLDSTVKIPGIIWDGKADTINANIKLYKHAQQKDTLDTLVVKGTVLKSSNSAALAHALATVSLAFAPDSLNYSLTLHDSTKSDGSYMIKYRDTTKTSKIFIKVVASANNFVTSPENFGKVVMPDTNRGARAIPYNFLAIKLDSVTNTADTLEHIVVQGSIKDSSQTRFLRGATVRVSLGADTTYPTVIITTADTTGNYSVSASNSAKISHVFYKVESIAPGYAYSFYKKDTTIAGADQLNDTIKAAPLALPFDRSVGDTLFVSGLVTDSLTPQNPKNPINNAIVKIRLAADSVSLATVPVFATCTTGVSRPAGTYLFKIYNSVELGHVFGKIEVTCPQFIDASSNNDCVIVPNDRVNDTLTMNCKVFLSTQTVRPGFRRGLPLVQIPVKIFDLRGRQIASFTYDSYGESLGSVFAGSQKFIDRLAADVCIVRIGSHGEMVRKIVPSLHTTAR